MEITTGCGRVNLTARRGGNYRWVRMGKFDREKGVENDCWAGRRNLTTRGGGCDLVVVRGEFD